MSISGSLANPDLLLPSNRRRADQTRLTSGLRRLALPAVDSEWMGALRNATSSFGVALFYDVYENFFGTDLVDPMKEGMLKREEMMISRPYVRKELKLLHALSLLWTFQSTR